MAGPEAQRQDPPRSLGQVVFVAVFWAIVCAQSLAAVIYLAAASLAGGGL